MPTESSSTPISSAARSARSRDSRRSSSTSATVLHTAVTNSIVFERNSRTTRWFGSIVDITCSNSPARGVRSRVVGSTRASSHSTPNVGAGDALNATVGGCSDVTMVYLPGVRRRRRAFQPSVVMFISRAVEPIGQPATGSYQPSSQQQQSPGAGRKSFPHWPIAG